MATMLQRRILIRPNAQKPATPLRRNPMADEDKARAEVREDLKLLATLDADIDAIMEKREAALARIDQVMREARLTVVTGSGKTAELSEAFTRQSRTIDPQKFRNRVSNDAFWGSITVSVQKAKEFLSDRELETVSDVVPAQSLGVKLKVSDAKKSKKE